MSNRSARSWKEYNLAKEIRRWERAALEAAPVRCEDCSGTGADPGSLHEPEECKTCMGSGKLLSDRVERKLPGTATTALSNLSTTRLSDGPTKKANP